jgi:UPF0755 protein
MKKRRKPHPRAPYPRAFVLVAIAVVLVAAAWASLYSLARSPLDLAPGAQLRVAQGATLRSLTRQLEQTGATGNATLLRWAIRLAGRGNDLKAGVYRFDAPLTPLALIAKIERGDVSQIAVKFIEGWNLAQLRAALKAEPLLDGGVEKLDNAGLMEKLGIGAAVTALGGDPAHPEGWFFPDTYFVAPHSDGALLLRRAFEAQREKLLAAWATRAPGLPYQTPYEALVMASIVEKETGAAHERPLIAGVFVNRMKIGMRLQTDPTVIYGVGDSFDGNLTKAHLLTDTPYNTYTRTGLPPTPIALPGEAAIRAALNPQKTAALYFVARGDGTHVFSNSLVEHNRAVNRYQR